MYVSQFSQIFYKTNRRISRLHNVHRNRWLFLVFLTSLTWRIFTLKTVKSTASRVVGVFLQSHLSIVVTVVNIRKKKLSKEEKEEQTKRLLREVHTAWRFDRWRLSAVVAFRRVVSRHSPRHRTLFLCLSTRSVEVRKMIERNREGTIGIRWKRKEERVREQERERHPSFSAHSDILRVLRAACLCLVGYVLRIYPTKVSSVYSSPGFVSSPSASLLSLHLPFHHPYDLGRSRNRL